MIPIEASWRLRPAYRILLAALILVPCAMLVLAANGRRQKAYDAVSVEYEGQEYAPHFVGNMLKTDEVLPNGLHESASWDRTRIGSFQNGRASGEWKIFDLEGHECGHVTLKDGQPYGPCEFWDVSGKRRVRGAYKGWLKRVGLWTLDNVLGDGRTYVVYRPAWSLL